MRWQLQEAKQRLSELIRSALDDGPQVVTRRGEDVAVVISMDEYRRLRAPRADFKDFLRAAPDLDQLDIPRDRNPGRVVELGPEH
jgi:prevent-host-death family protein